MTEKKGMPTWAWFAIGCAGLMAVILIVVITLGFFAVKKAKDVVGDFSANPEMTAAKMIVRMHPDYEEVSENADDGTITIREKKSGKEITVNVDEIKDGKFSFDTDQGHVELSAKETAEGGAQLRIKSAKGNVVIGGGAESGYPSWIPVPEEMHGEGQFAVEENGQNQGSVVLSGDMDKDAIANFYEEALKDAGFTIQKNSFSAEKQSMTVLQGENSEKGWNLTVTITMSEDGPSTILSYREKAQG